MTAASQLDVIKNDDRIFVTVADIAPILKADPLYLRETASAGGAGLPGLRCRQTRKNPARAFPAFLRG